ncbi:hypothetical protein F5Y03DRAFT_393336 [Xylaria venustula]|nr:hypothetical protein F5Y03DRAFT_393336 [Xylaria venustula]
MRLQYILLNAVACLALPNPSPWHKHHTHTHHHDSQSHPLEVAPLSTPGPGEMEIYAPTYRLSEPFPYGGWSFMLFKCKKFGPQCLDFPPGVPANETMSVRVYCKLVHFPFKKLKPAFMSPCPEGSRCKLVWEPPLNGPNITDYALWTQDEEGNLPGLDYVEDLSSWINLEGKLQLVEGEDSNVSGDVSSSMLIIPPPNSQSLKPPPYKFECIVEDKYPRNGNGSH